MKRYVRADITDISDESRDFKYELARDPNTPTRTLLRLFDIPDRGLRAEVLRNPNVPLDVLRPYAVSSIDDYRVAVAENPNTPADVLELMAEDQRIGVQRSIAENPNTPAKILSQLSNGRYGVRVSVARNPNTPADILQKLSQDEDNSVRLAVARNPSTPKSVLQNMTVDGCITFVLEFTSDAPIDEPDFAREIKWLVGDCGYTWIGAAFQEDLDPTMWDEEAQRQGIIYQFTVCCAFIYDKELAEEMFVTLTRDITEHGYRLIDKGGWWFDRPLSNVDSNWWTY